jgi:hypothetical protein
MPITVVLAVGIDLSHLRNQISAWKSAGFVIVFAESIREAIGHFRLGDFDLVLLGDSISGENRERFAFLMRSMCSRVPLVCAAESPEICDDLVDPKPRRDPGLLLKRMEELSASQPVTRSMRAPSRVDLP